MAKRRIFLSDLHLDNVRDARFTCFQECLRMEAGWADEIVVLGDLFEAWVGDDDDSELAENACQALRDTAAKTRVLVMAGNRDFLCGGRFAARTGAVMIDDPFLTDDALLLTHGDALCTADLAYAKFRALVRAPRWRKTMLAKPLDERRRIGAAMRAASSASQANRSANIADVTPDAAVQLAATHGATTMIHGHTHRPGVHQNATLRRYVLGDWARCGWVLRQRGEHFDLECFALSAPYNPPVPEGG